jgi:hypothetical protein
MEKRLFNGKRAVDSESVKLVRKKTLGCRGLGDREKSSSRSIEAINQ